MTVMLSGCWPIITQPYDNPVTDGIALGEPVVTGSEGMDRQAADTLASKVLSGGFVPLLYSGNGQSEDKLKFHIGESEPLGHQYSALSTARILAISEDRVQLSLRLPAAGPGDLNEPPELVLDGLASFSYTAWNDGRDHAWQVQLPLPDSDPQQFIVDWEISGSTAGEGFTISVRQPARRISQRHWYWGYGWITGESPLGTFQPAY
ncbi:MAG: hypothetical protein R3F46_00720 [bacterium]